MRLVEIFKHGTLAAWKNLPPYEWFVENVGLSVGDLVEIVIPNESHRFRGRVTRIEGNRAVVNTKGFSV